jgi:hypothetical protein
MLRNRMIRNLHWLVAGESEAFIRSHSHIERGNPEIDIPKLFLYLICQPGFDCS